MKNILRNVLLVVVFSSLIALAISAQGQSQTFSVNQQAVTQVDRNTAFSIQLSATSSVNEWQLMDAPPWMAINSATGELSGTTNNIGEAYYVAVRALDASGYDDMYFVFVVGDQTIHYVGPSETHTSLLAAHASVARGDVVIVRTGVYTGNENSFHPVEGGYAPMRGGVAPSGPTGASYTTYIAEQPNGVEIPQIDHTHFGGVDHSYIAYKGFHVPGGVTVNGRSSSELANHVKVTHTSSENGFTTTRSRYLLFENNFAYGNSRNKFNVWGDVSHIVFRRNVARHDFSTSTDPTASLMHKDGTNVMWQNNIVIDQHPNMDHFAASQLHYGAMETIRNGNITFRDSVVINVPFFIHFNDDPLDTILVENNAYWDVGVGAMLLGDISLNRLTVGGANPQLAVRPTSYVDSSTWTASTQGLFNNWRSGVTVSATNSIFTDINTNSGTVVLQNFANSNNNMIYPDSPGVGISSPATSNEHTSIDPRDGATGNGATSVLYPVRVEAGSDAANLGVGANVLQQRGVSGTMWGETGWDTYTGKSIWPFPYEDLIKQRMGSYSISTTIPAENPGGSDGLTAAIPITVNGSRGFAAPGTGLYGGPVTLTSYIWEYLGNACPAEVCDYAASAAPVNYSQEFASFMDIVEMQTNELTAANCNGDLIDHIWQDNNCGFSMRSFSPEFVSSMCAGSTTNDERPCWTVLPGSTENSVQGGTPDEALRFFIKSDPNQDSFFQPTHFSEVDKMNAFCVEMELIGDWQWDNAANVEQCRNCEQPGPKLFSGTYNNIADTDGSTWNSQDEGWHYYAHSRDHIFDNLGRSWHLGGNRYISCLPNAVAADRERGPRYAVWGTPYGHEGLGTLWTSMTYLYAHWGSFLCNDPVECKIRVLRTHGLEIKDHIMWEPRFVHNANAGETHRVVLHNNYPQTERMLVKLYRNKSNTPEASTSTGAVAWVDGNDDGVRDYVDANSNGRCDVGEDASTPDTCLISRSHWDMPPGDHVVRISLVNNHYGITNLHLMREDGLETDTFYLSTMPRYSYNMEGAGAALASHSANDRGSSQDVDLCLLTSSCTAPDFNHIDIEYLIISASDADLSKHGRQLYKNEEVWIRGRAADVDADTLTYEFLVDDTVIDSGTLREGRASVRHTFANNGLQVIKFRVSDPDGHTETKTRTIDVVDRVVPKDAHEYFNFLTSHPDIHGSDALRTIDAVENAVVFGTASRRVTSYDPSMDGAKFRVPTDSGKAGIGNQVRISYPGVETGNLFLSWEAQWDAGFTNFTDQGVETYKAFQIARDSSPSDQRRLEIRNRFSLSNPTDVSKTDLRHYIWQSDTETEIRFNRNDPRYTGPIEDFFVKPDTWTRYFAYVDFDNLQVSLWATDNVTPTVLLYDRHQFSNITYRQLTGQNRTFHNGLDGFWFEFDTSQHRIGGEDLYMWGRNLAVLYNATNNFDDVQALVDRGAMVEIVPTVSSISHDTTDLDAQKPGIQIYKNTVVDLSATISHAGGADLNYSWTYRENNGSEIASTQGQVARGVQTVVSSLATDYSSVNPPFTYEWLLHVDDNNSNRVTRSITIEVLPEIVAQDVVRVTDVDTQVQVTLNATDAQDDPLQYNILNGPGNGQIVANGNGFTYTPDEGFSGKDNFTYRATDGTDQSNVATVTIFVGALNQGLVAHYTFDSNSISGTTVQDVFGNNDGTIDGATATAGIIGQALQFDGVGNAVDINGFDVSGSELTISLWFNADDFGVSDARLISKASDVNEQDHYWMLSTNSDAQTSVLRGRLKAGGTTSTFFDDFTINADEWTHAVLRYDGSTLDIFTNGNQTHSEAKTGALDQDNAVNLAIGNNPVQNRAFDGAIDDVRIYSRALTTDEIGQLYALGNTTPAPAPIGAAPTVDAVIISATDVDLDTAGYQIYRNEPMLFRFGAADADDDALTYDFDVNGNEVQAGSVPGYRFNVPYTFTNLGSHTGRFVVDDGNGNTAQSTLTVEVVDRQVQPISHDYYNTLVSHPDHLHSQSLRNQSDIAITVAKIKPEKRRDPAIYDGTIDAAKWFLGKRGDIRLGDQIKTRISDTPITNGTLFFTWEARWNDALSNKSDLDELRTHKAFQLAKTQSPRRQLRIEVRTNFRNATEPEVAGLDLRTYAFKSGSRNAPVEGQINNFYIQPNTWTRFWAFVDFRNGNNGYYSLWVADEMSGTMQLFDRIPMDYLDNVRSGGYAEGLDAFWWEFNTSQDRFGLRDFLIWGRNFASLFGIKFEEAQALVDLGSLSGDTIYVTTSGTGDGSLANPLGSIQAALNAVQPGQTIVVGPGIYSESLTTQRAGTADDRIKLHAEKGPGTVIVQNSGRVLDLRHPYYTIEDFVLDGNYRQDADAVRITDNGDHTILRHLEVRRSGDNCINMASPEDLLFENLYIHHCVKGLDVDAHGITGAAVRDLRVKDTEIYMFTGDAFQIDDGRVAPGWDSIYFDNVTMHSGALDVTVNGVPQGTLIGENGVDTKAGASYPRANLVINNSEVYNIRQSVDNNWAAFVIKENVAVTIANTKVHNSEIAYRLRGPAEVTVYNSVVHDVDTAVRYEDNIPQLNFWSNTLGHGIGEFFDAGSSNRNGLDVRNNLILNDTRPIEATHTSNRLATDADFVAASEDLYELVKGSRAIDAAINVSAVLTDIRGHNRTHGPAPDVGAYEYVPLRPFPDGSVILEDFESIRLNGNGGPLWEANSNPNQVVSLVEKDGDTRLQSIVTATGNTGPGVDKDFYIHFHPNEGSPRYPWPEGFVQTYIKNGTWDTEMNRLRFWMQCDQDISFDPRETIILGTYVKNHTNIDTNTQGHHYYNHVSMSLPKDRWTLVEFNAHPQHLVGNDGNTEWGNEPTLPEIGYYDGMTRFYVDMHHAQTYPMTCWMDEFVLFKETDEPDDLVAGIAVAYTGSAYRIGFNGNKLSGQEYDVAYSRSSMKEHGFDSGTVFGRVNGGQGSSYTGMELDTPPMAENPNGMYFAIRPVGKAAITEIFLPDGPSEYNGSVATVEQNETPVEPPVTPTTDYISGHFDRVPNFAKNPTKTVTAAMAPPDRNGNPTRTWSELFTAQNLGVTNSDDVILIEQGASVLFDDTMAEIYSLGVAGHLQFSTLSDTELKVSNLLVYKPGHLEVGSEDTPIPANRMASITLRDTPLNAILRENGPLPNTNGVWDPEQFGNALIVFGKLSMHGAPLNRTFSRSVTELFVGDDSITLEDDISDWKIGDTIVIPDTREMVEQSNPRQGGTYDPQWEEFKIRDISGNTLYLGRMDDHTSRAQLAHDHLGARDGDFNASIPGDKGNLAVIDILDRDNDGDRTEARVTKEGRVMRFLPHVMNLDRNVQIKSENQSGVRGHTIFLGRADIDLRYTEFKDMGRTLNKPLNTTVFDVHVYDSNDQLLGIVEVSKGGIVRRVGSWPGNYITSIRMGDVEVHSGGNKISNYTVWNATYIGQNQIARYALHTHHLIGPRTAQQNGHQFTILGNSFNNIDSFDPTYTPTHPKESHDGFNFPKWAIAIHGSHFGLIKDNVIYNAAGSALVTEDGSETGNVFEQNMIARVKSFKSGWRFTEEGQYTTPRGNRITFGHTGRTAVAFWFRGPYNYVRDNVAANILAYDQPDTAYGYKYIQRYTGNKKIPVDANEQFLQGADPHIDSRAITADMNARNILQFENNEVYGATESGLTIWWVGSFGLTVREQTKQSVLKDVKMWHINNHGIYFYPSNNFLIDGFTFRGNGVQHSACCGSTLIWGDYQVSNHTVQHADIQGSRTSIGLPSRGYRDQPDGFNQHVIKNSYLRAKNNNLVASLTWAVSGGQDNTSRRTIIENVKMDAWPRNTPTNIVMRYPEEWRGGNRIARNDFHVVNYNGLSSQDTEDFRVYWLQQDPDFIVPQTTTRITGSPEANLTNTENWNRYGLAIGGSIAPCDDQTTYPEIHGFVCNVVAGNASTPDTTPPTSPTSLQSSVQTNSTVTLTWVAATDNVGIARYAIFRDNVEIATTTQLSFVDSLLTPDTVYGYHIVARDTSGNTARSDLLNVRTRANPQPAPNLSGTHAYFDYLIALPEAIHHRAYRNQTQIDADVHGPADQNVVFYDSNHDAMKQVVPANVNEPRQVRTSFSKINEGNILFTFDSKFQGNFNAERDAVTRYKAYQLAVASGIVDQRFELGVDFHTVSPPDVGTPGMRKAVNSDANSDRYPYPGIIDGFTIEGDTWTRHWALVDFETSTFTWWMADEDTPPTKIYDSVWVNLTPSDQDPRLADGLSEFWFEFDTSQSQRNGAETGIWSRNLVVLHNVSDPQQMVTIGRNVTAVAVTPLPSSKHRYFDALAARPDAIFAKGYRNQTEIDEDIHGKPDPTRLIYDPIIDGARANFSGDFGRDITARGLRPIFERWNETNMLYYWENRWNDAFETERGHQRGSIGLHTHKMFQLACKTCTRGDERRLEVRMRYGGTAPDIATVDLRRYYFNATDDIQQRNPTLFDVQSNEWTRFWAYVDYDNSQFSLWVGDSISGTTLVYDRLEMNFSTPGVHGHDLSDRDRLKNATIEGLDSFWFEYASSQTGSNTTGPNMKVWGRNLAVLANISGSYTTVSQLVASGSDSPPFDSGPDDEPADLCGNGRIDPGEQCDGTLFGKERDPRTGQPLCQRYDHDIYNDGRVMCTAQCTIDLSACNNEGKFNFSINWSHWNEQETTNITKFNRTELRQLARITFQNLFGGISFGRGIDFTRNLDITRNLKVRKNAVIVNSDELREFNRSAMITIHNVTVVNPRIMRDGEICPEDVCKLISYVNGTVVFNVTRF